MGRATAVTTLSARSGNGARKQTKERMATFRRGDVVKVPFPYTDRQTRKTRPALVASANEVEETHDLLWVIMITSAENRGWEGDIPVNDLALAGLPAPSVIRCVKIATIDAGDALALGRVSPAVMHRVNAGLRRYLGMRPMLSVRPTTRAKRP